MILHKETLLVQGARRGDPFTGAISVPIYQSATFRHPGLGQSTGYDYSRSENPTREALEAAIAALEEGAAGFAFSSGMAAITAVLDLFSPGDHIVVSDDVYGGTYRLFEQIYRPRGLAFSFVDGRNHGQIEAAIQPATRALFLESPSNPTMKICDIRQAAQLSRQRGLCLIVDNTFMTPYFQQPLTLGADIVVHSGTKYLGGHNDTLAGLAVAKDASVADRLRFIQMSTGAVLSPLDSWLILRGMKTLALRLEKQQANALAIAAWLQKHPAVDEVHYVGLPDHPGHEKLRNQASGYGAMISFTVRDAETAQKVLGKAALIAFAESLGGVESLITYPLAQTHAAVPEELRARLGITDRLLRLSVGIENLEDLINDLAQALDARND